MADDQMPWHYIEDEGAVAKTMRADARRLLATLRTRGEEGARREEGNREEDCDGLAESNDRGFLGPYRCGNPQEEDRAWRAVVEAAKSGTKAQVQEVLQRHQAVACRELRRDVAFILYLLDGNARTFAEMDAIVDDRTVGTARGSMATSFKNMAPWKREARYHHRPDPPAFDGPNAFSVRGTWRPCYLDKIGSGRWRF